MYNQLKIENYKLWRFTPLYACTLFYIFTAVVMILRGGMTPLAASYCPCKIAVFMVSTAFLYVSSWVII